MKANMQVLVLPSFAFLCRLVFLGCILTFASATNFKVKDVTCTGGIFSKSSLTTTCSDDCDGGDTLTITGTVMAKSDFNNESVIVVPCIVGFHCFDEYRQEVGSICDWISDENCGSAGTHNVYKQVKIPKEASNYHYDKWNFLVTVKVLIGGDDSCSQSASAYGSPTSSTSNHYGTTITGASAVMIVFAGGLFWKKRRTISADSRREDRNFVQLKDFPEITVV